MEKVYLGAGCFWCSEAAIKRLKGVKYVLPGYSGGALENPSYKDVCSGASGHAEVVEVEFDPKTIGFEKILDVFFTVHDPTTKDQQGADVGSQYRSVILYTSDSQRKKAEAFIKKIGPEFDKPIVTEVKKFVKFWPAEDYHKDYFAKNPLQPYCMFVVRKKVHKVEEKFKSDLKE